MSGRCGAGKFGGLCALLLVVTIGYVAVHVGDVDVRYDTARDAIAQEARFASARADDAIRLQRVSRGDSLGRPEDAGRARLSADDSAYVELPILVRQFRVHLSAEGRP